MMEGQLRTGPTFKVRPVQRITWINAINFRRAYLSVLILGIDMPPK